LRIWSAWAARAVFPPEQVAEVKALACQLPATHGLPRGRFSRTELHRLVIERGLSDASASTIWRWLHDDALKPRQQRSWIFVRDPLFAEKAGRVLDLYQRRFEGRRLRPDEYVICADEKSQLQALGRRHATLPPGPGRAARIEFDYRRNFSIVQRKALTPNDFGSLDALAERLLRFGDHYRQIAQPFEWTFTRTNLERLLARIDAHQPDLQLAA
jgi:hypothetical protein